MVKLFTPSRTSRPSLPKKAELTIDGMSSEGRGIAHHQRQTVFVDGALPGERCLVRFTGKEKGHLTGETVSVISPASYRREPFCRHYEECGGCDWQHLDRQHQLQFKQDNLLQSLKKHAGIEPRVTLDPLTDQSSRYRNRAKFSVWFDKNKQRVIGFREKSSKNIVGIQTCSVLNQRIDDAFQVIKQWAESQSVLSRIDQIDITDDNSRLALILSYSKSINDQDLQVLTEGLESLGFETDVWLKNRSQMSLYQSSQISPEYTVKMPNLGLELLFSPSDFIQANQGMNEAMVSQAVELLCAGMKNPDTANVLDLFCGIGNFSIALAQKVGSVVGVELHEEMVAKAEVNAQRSGTDNASFVAADLHAAESPTWLKGQFQGVLLDPPRAGAKNTMALIEKLQPESLVYVSCNPATLIRDAKALQQFGYQLDSLGLIDMFAYTHHSEAVASFVRKK
ncbi:23S rRNA (uracil(1939)-C(5))-methyltransferase RlmD [Sessilibacter corallicola]|uniref:23S rRNA (uracil(1939)-C(5))-methyltransferase RlmD n=1 Tax=Sessilibacter corallicola TaxID=2904075 RepID=UPI001E43E5E0|nr:23S rRNA (uracil(1939)-C(5))-methyltransferase RlmD [Sessilibacter corallicola]MCE2026952.1 23S rRNA (uracil(1939)-C(5))-methyltransferase RlmD [Sessilibacter corallicola]